jgi:hypothetical protein
MVEGVLVEQQQSNRHDDAAWDRQRSGRLPAKYHPDEAEQAGDEDEQGP